MTARLHTERFFFQNGMGRNVYAIKGYACLCNGRASKEFYFGINLQKWSLGSYSILLNYLANVSPNDLKLSYEDCMYACMYNILH
jgi:hypothetical protein